MTMNHSIHKAPGGIIRISINEGKVIKKILISGDFFVYPEESIEQLEKHLVGTKTRDEELLKAITEFYEANHVEAHGIEPKDFVAAIRKAIR